MPDDAQVDRRESIEALRRELDARTVERALPLQGGGLRATPEDLAASLAENRRLREQLCEVLAELSLPLDGGGAGWGCRSRGARW
jgi:hypothetical protein